MEARIADLERRLTRSAAETGESEVALSAALARAQEATHRVAQLEEPLRAFAARALSLLGGAPDVGPGEAEAPGTTSSHEEDAGKTQPAREAHNHGDVRAVASANGDAGETAPLHFGGLEPAKQDLLSVLAGLASLGLEGVERRTVAVLAGRGPKSSALRQDVAELRALGLLSLEKKLLTLTDRGRCLTPAPGEPASQAELHARWLAYLNDYEGGLLRVLLDAYPKPLTRSELARRAGRGQDSSALRGALSSMRKFGLVAYEGASDESLVEVGALLWEVPA